MNEIDLEHLSELQPLADPTIALDFLLSVKNGVRNTAIAITESSTPDVRAALHTQLETSLTMHEKLSQLMMNKGWFHPYNVSEQFQLDLVSSQTVLKIASLDLFPPQPPTQAPGNKGQKEPNELGN
ncbi:spore coat protein [Tumebacillus permanentifrigoris]|uniref:Coat F domain-containing protein n=1 Tax=Tumebacillus permanentifrigoris TaxID=378543 RepID=A0A316D348_9BACL|nr:spore coat protein [Tumebacillus permanentifrigoris]PWK05396.1 coat F domain-containing protein [Tumebacillus permanentifrigoris]